MIMQKRAAMAFAALAALSVVACGQAPTQTEAPAAPAASAPAASVVSVLENNGQVQTFRTLVQAAGLEERLSGAQPVTIFAPWDDAFASLSETELARLQQPAYRAELEALLNRHIIEGRHGSLDYMNATTEATTLAGTSISVTGANGGLRVGEAAVLQSDLEAPNGVVHIVDRILPAPATP